MMKIENDQGVEVEVYTAEEVQAREAAAVAAKEAEFGKTKAEIEAERDEARKALGDRSREFGQFRKLNDETVAKLSIAEKTIYENQLAQKELEDKRVADEKIARDRSIDTAIRAKVGADEKLFTKVKDMYGLIGIQANTPDEISQKVLASLGALGQTEPNLVASVAGFSSGSFEPPKPKGEEEKSFADTERGQKGMDELGLKIPKKA